MTLAFERRSIQSAESSRARHPTHTGVTADSDALDTRLTELRASVAGHLDAARELQNDESEDGAPGE